jgi:hypothetical protein
MTAQRFRRQHLAATADPPARREAAPWQSLSELGRSHGLSALQMGQLMIQAELRESNGEPTFRALAKGLARRLPAGQHHPAIWHGDGCSQWLESRRLIRHQPDLIGLWAELLSALDRGEPAISVSAQEMAMEIPSELVSPVNDALRSRGSRFQVNRGERTPACQSHAPDAASKDEISNH